ncbi:MAG: methyltransferase [Clostridia bacterium]|nr:methyltransferase [Clostridia bacterium]
MIDEIGIGGFKLKQSNDFLKLGTDAMLLSHFANIKKHDNVCDLGCGNGAISILLCARHPEITVTGIEILEGAAQLAQENVEINNLSNRMQVIHGDVVKIKDLLPAESFTHVVSNPPYMKLTGGLHTENENLLSARMEINSTIDDMCRGAAYLLKYQGSFSVVYRPERLSVLFSALKAHNFTPKRLRFVQNDVKTEPFLVLVEARKHGKEGLKVLPTLFIRDESGNETREVREIYQRNT